jgi:hypothetical protein
LISDARYTTALTAADATDVDPPAMRKARSTHIGGQMPDHVEIPDLPDPIDLLTGRWEGWRGAPEPDGVRAPWPKFRRNGAVLPFPGLTVVCHIPPSSDTFAALVGIQEALKGQAFAEHFTYLPPSSFHMTLFDVANETTRGTQAWPENVPADADWATVGTALDPRVAGLRLPNLEPKARALFGGFSVVLTGRDRLAETRMRSARDALRDRTRIWRTDHAAYMFHITLAYPLRFLPEETAKEVDAVSTSLFDAHRASLDPVALGPAQFCDFADMHAFIPRFSFPKDL